VSGWEIKVHWAAEPGVTAPEFTSHLVDDENLALDAAVAVLDGARHPWLPVKATGAQIRPEGGAWQTVRA
jgi:hypothetical protein